MREPKFLLDWTPNYKPNNIIVFDDLHTNLQDNYEAYWDGVFAMCCGYMDPETACCWDREKDTAIYWT